MEECIDQLAELSRSQVEFPRFVAQVLSSAVQLGGVCQAILWMQIDTDGWQPIGQRPAEPVLDSAVLEQRQTTLAEVASTAQSRIVTQWGLFPIRSAGQTVAILDVTCTAAISSAASEFLAALCEITADYLALAELRQLRALKTQWQKWDHYTQRLGISPELLSVCAVIANDGRLLAECDRVSVLTGQGRTLTLRAVSGVDRVEPRSSTTRSLERLAGQVSQSGQPAWSSEPAGQLTESIERHLREAQASAIGFLPILSHQKHPIAVIVVEQFQPLQNPEAWRTHGEQLALRSATALRSAWERSEIPWLGLWGGLRHLPEFLVRPWTLFVLLLVAAIIASLCLIRTEFTVTGSAKLWPAHRREVFASTSGIIDQIHVDHGAQVQKDQPLLVLRDPQLESEAPRIIGEIATVNERLKGIQAARLTGSNFPDAVARARQLVSEEEELKQQLLTLDAQRTLIEERKAALTLSSPIAGMVLTWDVTQQLTARPVERGQSLLTIGDTSGPWIVELFVEDKDIGPILRTRHATPEPVVDFQLTAEPGPIYQGRVHDVSLSTQTDGNGRSYVRIEIEFDRSQMAQLRPGATVIPRVRCGQKPLGYVWLHDLIEAVRTRILF